MTLFYFCTKLLLCEIILLHLAYADYEFILYFWIKNDFILFLYEIIVTFVTITFTRC